MQPLDMQQGRPAASRAFVRSLGSAQRRALTALDNRAGVLHLLSTTGLIALLVALVILAPLGWLFMLPLGIALVFLFTLMHEASHRTVFVSPLANDAVMSLCGLLIFLPPNWFRYFHYAHHRYTQDPGRDPELASPKPQSLPAYLVHLCGLRVWYEQIKSLLLHALGRCRDSFIPASGKSRVYLEARIMLCVYAGLLLASLYLQSALLLHVWIVPLLLGQPFLRMYLLAEHARCPYCDNMFRNTRTTFTNRFVRWLAWNMPYHTEHHVFPAVPFHRLPELHRLMREHAAETARGYARFNRAYVQSLRAGR